MSFDDSDEVVGRGLKGYHLPRPTPDEYRLCSSFTLKAYFKGGKPTVTRHSWDQIYPLTSDFPYHFKDPHRGFKYLYSLAESRYARKRVTCQIYYNPWNKLVFHMRNGNIIKLEVPEMSDIVQSIQVSDYRLRDEDEEKYQGLMNPASYISEDDDRIVNEMWVPDYEKKQKNSKKEPQKFFKSRN